MHEAVDEIFKPPSSSSSLANTTSSSLFNTYTLEHFLTTSNLHHDLRFSRLKPSYLDSLLEAAIMSNPTILNKDQIVHFIIIMLHLHLQLAGEPAPKLEWSKSYKAIAGYFHRYRGGSYSPKSLKDAWVMIHKDTLNPKRGTSEWNNNAPGARPAAPWNEDVSPLEQYTHHFRVNEDSKRKLEETIAEVQQKYRVFWDERDRSLKPETEKESDAQLKLRDQAYEEISKIPDFDASNFRELFREPPWPQDDTYWYRRPPAPNE